MTAESIYVVTDIETTGMAPGVHSMISLASVAVHADGAKISEFQANLLPLPDAQQLESTMEWWKGFPEAWEASTSGARDPAIVMAEYDTWLRALPGKPVFVGYPVTFDYSFVWYYLWRFCGGTNLSHGALDMKTLAMALTGKDYVESSKRHWPADWFPPEGIHSHKAIDDAREQAYEFSTMLQLCTESGGILALQAKYIELKKAYLQMSHEIDQTLGKALGYPWYKDDQKNFPGSTGADGVCTGEHVPETLAMEAADWIRAMKAAFGEAVPDE